MNLQVALYLSGSDCFVYIFSDTVWKSFVPELIEVSFVFSISAIAWLYIVYLPVINPSFFIDGCTD